VAGLAVHERDGRHGGAAGVLRHARLLRRGRYEAILLGPPSFRAALVAVLAGVPRRIGHRGDGRNPLLTDRLPRSPRGERPFPAEMVDLGDALLGGNDPPANPASPSLPGVAAWEPAAFAPGPPLLALAPGTTYGEAKTWPVARVREFLDLAAPGFRVVLVGDRQARGFTAELRRGTGWTWGEDPGGDARIIDLCGRTELPEAVRVLKACGGFVGNDSGLMHVAAALGLPTVGVFGSSNPDWTAPGGRWTGTVAARGYPCRPCYRRTCNQPRFCLEDVTAGEVFGSLEEIMRGAARAEGGRA